MSETQMVRYDPALPKAIGWESLSEARKKWLQAEFSELQRDRGTEISAALRVGLRLSRIGKGLEDGKEKIGITDVIVAAYGVKNKNKGFRRMRMVEQLSKLWGADFVTEIAFGKQDYFVGIGDIGIGDLITVAKALPAPPPAKKRTPEVIEAYMTTEVREGIRKGRIRHQAKKIKFTEDDGKGELFDAIRLNIARAKDEGHIQTSAQVRSYIRDPIGWALEYHAVSGDLTVERKSIPEKFVPRPVGRPSE